MEGDLEEVQRHVPGVFATGLASGQVPLQHDPERIAEAILSIVGMGRVPMVFTEGNGVLYEIAVPVRDRSSRITGVQEPAAKSGIAPEKAVVGN